MKFRKKPVVIEAVQWFPGVAVEGVEECVPELIFSKDEKHYYLSALSELRADAWMPVVLPIDPKEQIRILPFSFWKVKSGRRCPATTGEVLTERYLRYQEAKALPPSYGLIDTLEGRRLTVSAGDWIITGVKGEKYPCKPDIFAETYEAVP